MNPVEPGSDLGPSSATSEAHLREYLEIQLGAAGRGDKSAFAALYDSVAPRVYGLVLRVLRDVRQSDEVTQEVFLQIWETADRFDPARGSARSWIMTLAHRRAVECARASEAERRRDETTAGRGIRTPSDHTAETDHAPVDGPHVRGAMATLSPAQRQALELAYFAGHTHVEISQRMEIPLGAAKTRIREGLTRLQDGLDLLAVEPEG